jgi:hypothetical protein
MSGPIIVLGWDGLDLNLAERFGVVDSFGGHAETIETYVNAQTGEPHTKELWPSMITGLHPDEHGIHAVTEGEGIEWGHPALNAASTLANGVVPKPALNYLGALLRERGAAVESYSRNYYREHDVQTVFDTHGGQAVSIPNYRTDHDRRLALDANRGGVWAELDVDRTGEGTDFTPGVDMTAIHDILGIEVGRRVGLAADAIAAGHPLVWCWFGCLDTVGHIEPAVEASLQRQYYEIAAAQTRAVRALAPDDATVVSISDHGIQQGEHTHHATVASDDHAPVAAIDHVFETADWIRRQDPGGHDGTAVDADAVDTVNDRLAALGYI